MKMPVTSENPSSPEALPTESSPNSSNPSENNRPPSRSRPTKRHSVEFNNNIKRMLLTFKNMVTKRLDKIDIHLNDMEEYCYSLEEKIDNLATMVDEKNSHMLINPNVSSAMSNEDSSNTGSSGNNLTLIALNSESDHPNGTWLGDESNPEMRVRCPISQTDLFHLNANCHTAEKMALCLLDNLFDRETQARSNMSGCGKHKKQQLDPLFIYGIQCHLIHKFGLDSKSWLRIKQNMDSKCRTAFRRKQRGLPLVPKRPIENGFFASDSDSNPGENLSNNSLSFQGDIEDDDPSGFSTMMSEAEIIHTDQGEIQVVHATVEQLAHIQKTHQFQIVSGDLLRLVEKTKTEDADDSDLLSNAKEENFNDSSDSNK